MTVRFALLVAEVFIVTFVLCHVALKVFPKLGLLDRPEKYGHKRAPIPYPTGVIFYIVFVLNLLFLTPLEPKSIGFILGLTLLLIVNFIDDRRGLPPLVRLGSQVFAGIILTLSGIGINVISNPLGGSPIILDAIFSGIFTILWLVLFVNTLNWMDEPGIVSGIAGISFLIIFLLSLFLSLRTNVGMEEIENASMVAHLAVVGVAMCAAFLLFDFPPAKMLMGDSGSITLGCIIAVLAIYAGGKIATTFLVLGFPVMDALFVIGRRIYRKKSPLKGDLNHFHHRLQRIGFSPRRTNMTIYGICFVFGTSALFLGTQGKFVVILGLIVLAALVEYWVMRKEKQKSPSNV